MPLAILTVKNELHGFMSKGLRLAALGAAGAPLKQGKIVEHQEREANEDDQDDIKDEFRECNRSQCRCDTN